MRRNQLLVCLMLALLLILPSSRVQASFEPDTPTNYCFPVEVQDRCLGATETISAVLAEWALNVGVGAAKTVDGLIWLLDRAAAFLFDIMVNSDWILGIKDQLLTSLTSLMPKVLQQVVMGSSGLMYFALALSGVLMIVPLVGSDQTRMVRPERVILWGCLLLVLFMGGSSTGYDLVNMVENLRLSVMQNIMGTLESPASKLIQSPMSASSREFDDQNLLQLPSSYENLYFPDPQTVEVTVKFFPQIGPQNTFIETKDSAKARASLAGTSLFFAFISLLGAYSLLLFAITFAFLGVAALVLILFLFAALPLGFFEFGNMILSNIIQKYMQIVFFSIGMAVFVRWVVTWISSFPNASDVSSALTWASLLLVVVAVLHVILSGAFNILISSAQVFSGSVQAVFSGAGMGSGMFGGMPAWAQAGGQAGGASSQNERTGQSLPDRAAALTNGALSAVGFHAASSVMSGNLGQAPKRADVFQQDENPRVQSSQSQQGIAPMPGPRLQQPGLRFPSPSSLDGDTLFAPKTAEAEASLQTLAGREGWQPEQVEMIKAASRRNEDPLNLASFPGFERSSPETLQQALRAAQVLTADTLANERPLIQPGTEKA